LEIAPLIYLAKNRKEKKMSHKHTIHGSDLVDLQAKHHSHNLFVVIAITFVVLLAVVLVNIQPRPRPGEVSNNASSEAVPDNNGMAMQYAQPWLDRQAAALAQVYPANNGMAMQYAQPWLDKQAAAPAQVYPANNGMAMQYAQPWLDKQAAAAAAAPAPVELKTAVSP
jgi:hypothetical protein